MSICWYEDDELRINFSHVPRVFVICARPNLPLGDIINAYKKPFVNENELNVELIDKNQFETYSFLISDGYTWDGATIPRLFWRTIGPKSDPRFLIPSMIHDVLCENHDYVNNDRYFSTCVFERLLYVSKVNPFSRWLIKHSVDNFQKFCGW